MAAPAAWPAGSELNPFVLRGVTPPRDSFVVRVPVGHAAGFREAYRALPAADRAAFTRVVSKKGDTRESVARRAGISVRQLLWYNRELKVDKRGRLRAGQTVLLPSHAVV